MSDFSLRIPNADRQIRELPDVVYGRPHSGHAARSSSDEDDDELGGKWDRRRERRHKPSPPKPGKKH